MSETSQGDGWWLASDGRWYPPSDTRVASPVSPPPPLPTGPVPTASKATLALVLAVASFFVCPFVGPIVALMVAAGGDRQIRESEGRLGWHGRLVAARITALAGLACWVFLVAIIAVPTFLGAKGEAQDRAAQSDLRNALVAEKTLAADADGAWTADPAALAAVEPSLRFEVGETPSADDGVYVSTDGELLG